ncbi:MAG: enoyl-CoA hydratase [Gammaproteobacteria bacterium HGW-Gammaproteobacteria-8]|nr:MAG: enoyl-CoA hydratase [Gammaproteobacteria bacterium HGW-Gammaproteobacteria-8]
MPPANLLTERTDAVVKVTINRPDKLNALDRASIDELRRTFTALIEDTTVRAIVLHGAGEKAFIAGADIAEIRARTPTQAERFSQAGQQLMRSIEQSPIPVIAAINGYALGGGFELALACPIRLASASARVGLPEIKLGLLPGFGGTQRLARLIGRGPALSLMLSGDPIGAERAEALGLVEKIAPDRDVVEVAMERAARIARAAPLAVRAILESVARGLDMPLDAALAFESSRFGLLCASEDAREGTAAFLEKRAARFTGR